MKMLTACCVALVTVASVAPAQSAAEHIAMGDRDHAANNFASALKHYEAALASDPNSYDALTKAAHDAVDLGEFNAKEEQRAALYKSAQDYARRAVAANPRDAEGHFVL